MPKFVAAVDLSKIPAKGLVPESSGTAPTSPVNGQLWTDTSTSPPTVKYWNGTSWIRTNGQDLPNGTISDAQVSSSAAIALSKLATNPLARANHTGTQTASTISDFDTQVRTSRLDQMAAPTAPVSLGSQRITSLADPSSAQDAATKAYVDNARAGLAGVKDPVRVASTSNVSTATPGATIDGVTLTTGDRVLLAGQTTGTQNGIWVFQGASSAMVRATDADAAGEVQDGTLVAVSEGTDAGKQYIQQATPSGAPGSWTQTWTVYNTAGNSYVAGNGLQLTGNSFSVVAADSSITVSGSGVTVGTIPINKGGTGATTAAAARTALSAVTAYSADVGALTAGSALNITHSLNTSDVQVYVREVSTGARIYMDETVVDANTVSLKADISASASTYRVVVQARA